MRNSPAPASTALREGSLSSGGCTGWHDMVPLLLLWVRGLPAPCPPELASLSLSGLADFSECQLWPLTDLSAGVNSPLSTSAPWQSRSLQSPQHTGSKAGQECWLRTLLGFAGLPFDPGVLPSAGTEMSSPGSPLLKSFWKAGLGRLQTAPIPPLPWKPAPPSGRTHDSGCLASPILSELEAFLLLTQPSRLTPLSGLYSCLSQMAFSLPLSWSSVMSAGNMTVGME